MVVLERESQPGYHSTGRSAALFLESYGTPQVRALTLASCAFLEAPPPGFTDTPLLGPRGCLFVAAPGQETLLEAHWQLLRAMSPRSRRLAAAGVLALMPVRGVPRAGGTIVCDAEVTHLERVAGAWQVTTRTGSESWYVKPDAGVLLGSPANADPVPPHDVQPEELDVAVAIDRIAMVKALAKPEVRAQLAKLGAVVVGDTPAEFATYLQRDYERWEGVIKAAAIKVSE